MPYKEECLALVDTVAHSAAAIESVNTIVNDGGHHTAYNTDFSAVVSKIKGSGADYVYWGGLHTEGGLIVRQMRDQGVKAVLMSGDGITSDEFASIGGPGVEGTLMTFPPDPMKRPTAAAVVKKFEAKKFKPESYTLYSYAAVEIIKLER